MIRRILALYQSIPSHERRITIPTFLTLIRMGMTVFVVFAMFKNCWHTAFILFLVAAATDLLDGFLARFLQEKTLLGAWLDPFADKFLVLSIFFTLAFVQSPLFHIPRWFVIVVFLKEFLLIGGAVIVYKKTGSLAINPTWLGKIAMAVQVLFITWLFACYFFNWVPLKTYYTMLALVVLCAVASLMHYALLAFKYVFFPHVYKRYF